MYFIKDTLNINDSVKIFESELNFNTAFILKKMLEEKVQKLILLSEQLDKIDKKLETFINNKNEEYTKINLDKSQTDSGGNN